MNTFEIGDRVWFTLKQIKQKGTITRNNTGLFNKVEVLHDFDNETYFMDVNQLTKVNRKKKNNLVTVNINLPNETIEQVNKISELSGYNKDVVISVILAVQLVNRKKE